MKIRTKIIGISGVAVLTATLFISGIIWNMLKNSREKEAYSQAYQSSYIFMNDFENLLERTGDDKTAIEYFLKNYDRNKNERQETYPVCAEKEMAGQEDFCEIYNPTIFSKKKLLNEDYETCEGEGEIGYCKIQYEEGNYLVFRKEFLHEFLLFQIVNVTYVDIYMKKLAVILLLLSLGVTVLLSMFLWVTIRKMLLPLQDLNRSAKKIAEGVYHERIKIRGKDEIAELGVHFNQMAEAVEAHTQKIEESERRKTLFMGNLTHELKTPMTAISGYAQTLLTMKLTKEDEEEALLYIYEQCGRLERLSKKMMRLLELDGETALHLTPVSAATLFDEAERNCKALLYQKDIRIEKITHGEVFQMDFDLMLDVLMNLIDNGIKASTPGSRIILSASKDRISVQDFGCGIPEEEKERILEPFYMIDKSRSRKNGGAGLGLALIALIVKHHGMKMEIDSQVGIGTTVNLQIDYKTMNT